jgi:hypothetical protein
MFDEMEEGLESRSTHPSDFILASQSGAGICHGWRIRKHSCDRTQSHPPLGLWAVQTRLEHSWKVNEIMELYFTTRETGEAA